MGRSSRATRPTALDVTGSRNVELSPDSKRATSSSVSTKPQVGVARQCRAQYFAVCLRQLPVLAVQRLLHRRVRCRERRAQIVRQRVDDVANDAAAFVRAPRFCVGDLFVAVSELHEQPRLIERDGRPSANACNARSAPRRSSSARTRRTTPSSAPETHIRHCLRVFRVEHHVRDRIASARVLTALRSLHARRLDEQRRSSASAEDRRLRAAVRCGRCPANSSLERTHDQQHAYRVEARRFTRDRTQYQIDVQRRAHRLQSQRRSVFSSLRMRARSVAEPASRAYSCASNREIAHQQKRRRGKHAVADGDGSQWLCACTPLT